VSPSAVRDEAALARLASRRHAELVAASLAAVAAITLPLPIAYEHIALSGRPTDLALRVSIWALPPAFAVAAALVALPAMRAAVGAATTEARRRARAKLIGLPLKITVALALCAAASLVAVARALAAQGLGARAVVGLALSTLAVYVLPLAPIGALWRARLIALIVAAGDEELPSGVRIPVGLQVGGGLLAVAIAALVPAGVLGAALLDAAAIVDARAHASASARRLAEAAVLVGATAERAPAPEAALSERAVRAATDLLTAVPLGGGQRAIVRAASGVLLPEEAAASLGELPFIEEPLSGALRGAALRIYFSPRRLLGPRLGVALLALLLLAAFIALAFGRGLGRELRVVAAQVDRVASDAPATQVGPDGDSDDAAVTAREVRAITRAANRLLDRVPRFTIESFLAIERAEEASRMKSRFLANMSHDLRSPLNSILGFSELILRGIEGHITDAQRAELTTVHARGNDLLRLLNEILDTAKLESGKLELSRQSLPPAELMRQALAETRRGREGIDDLLDISLQPGLPVLSADPLRLTQAVMHLLDHAIATAPGERIQVRLTDERDYQRPGTPRVLVIEVEYPIAPSPDSTADPAVEDHELLVETFRAGPTGRGLNLAVPLARRLIELHGGTLTVARPAPRRQTLRASVPIGVRVA
jgi:signal transduction histidine kinase